MLNRIGFLISCCELLGFTRAYVFNKSYIVSLYMTLTVLRFGSNIWSTKRVGYEIHVFAIEALNWNADHYHE